MLKESIINITQLAQFGNEFIGVTNIMESGIATVECNYSPPTAYCSYYLADCCIACPAGSCNGVNVQCGDMNAYNNKLTYLEGWHRKLLYTVVCVFQLLYSICKTDSFAL